MITDRKQNKQLPSEINLVFKELKILSHLRKAGIVKSEGFSCAYLFQLIFYLIFEGKNWFRILESKKSMDLPAKDADYRFLNQSTFAWRRFLMFLSSYTIAKVTRLTSYHRPKVLIIDDSSYERNRSKVSVK